MNANLQLDSLAVCAIRGEADHWRKLDTADDDAAREQRLDAEILNVREKCQDALSKAVKTIGVKAYCNSALYGPLGGSLAEEVLMDATARAGKGRVSSYTLHGFPFTLMPEFADVPVDVIVNNEETTALDPATACSAATQTWHSPSVSFCVPASAVMESLGRCPGNAWSAKERQIRLGELQASLRSLLGAMPHEVLLGMRGEQVRLHSRAEGDPVSCPACG